MLLIPNQRELLELRMLEIDEQLRQLQAGDASERAKLRVTLLRESSELIRRLVALRVTKPARVLVHFNGVFEARTLLRYLGCELEEASDALQCVATARHFRPHLILLDVDMPGASGFEVAGSLRNTSLSPYLLAARSEFADDDSRARCMKAGFDYVLTRPSDPRLVHQLIDAARQLASD
jgi:CheY-like chemotaxis protein